MGQEDGDGWRRLLSVRVALGDSAHGVLEEFEDDVVEVGGEEGEGRRLIPRYIHRGEERQLRSQARDASATASRMIVIGQACKATVPM